MAKKAPILLHQEAQTALIQTVNYFIQEGVPMYELQNIITLILNDLSKAIDNEMKQAREEYQQAVIAEQNAAIEETKSET